MRKIAKAKNRSNEKSLKRKIRTLSNFIEFFMIYIEHFACSYEKVSFVGYISDLGRDPTIAKTILECLIQ